LAVRVGIEVQQLERNISAQAFSRLSKQPRQLQTGIKETLLFVPNSRNSARCGIDYRRYAQKRGEPGKVMVKVTLHGQRREDMARQALQAFICRPLHHPWTDDSFSPEISCATPALSRKTASGSLAVVQRGSSVGRSERWNPYLTDSLLQTLSGIYRELLTTGLKTLRYEWKELAASNRWL
jgi:hypothetical protein